MRTKFIDGWYGVFPEGGAYEAVQVQGNEVIDAIYQSQAGSHRNGQNWHYIPVHDAIDAMGEDDLGETFNSDDVHAEFVRNVDREWNPSCVHVCRLQLSTTAVQMKNTSCT